MSPVPDQNWTVASNPKIPLSYPEDSMQQHFGVSEMTFTTEMTDEILLGKCHWARGYNTERNCARMCEQD